MIVALIGMGGTGKTTVARGVCKAVNSNGARCEYMHAQAAMPLSKFLLRTKHSLEPAKNKTSVKQGKNKLVMRAWLNVEYLDALLLHSKLKASSKKTVFVCDRHFYDRLVQFFDEGVIGKATVDFYAGLMPKPDLTFLLDAKETTVYKRKKEKPVAALKQERRAYLDFLNRNRNRLGKVILINADKPYKKVLDEVLSEIRKARK